METLNERYKALLDEPTPARALLEEIATVARVSVSTVRQWMGGDASALRRRLWLCWRLTTGWQRTGCLRRGALMVPRRRKEVRDEGAQDVAP